MRPLARSRLLRPQAPLWARLAIVLLAVLQTVAPSWHICGLQLGCECCVDEHHPGANDQDAGGPRALICGLPADEHAHDGPLAWISHPHADEGDNFCLAMLLQSMPGTQTAAPPLFIFQAIRAQVHPSPAELIPSARLRRVASRGPPSYSL